MKETATMKRMVSFITAVLLVLTLVLPSVVLAQVPPPPATPAAPVALAATVVHAGQVNLTWSDASTNETGFRVERATNATFTLNRVTADAAANTTSLSDATTAAVTAYFYRVFAVNATVDSAASNVATVTTPQSVPQVALAQPAPPTAQLVSGGPNVVMANAASPGSTISAAEFQMQFNDPVGTLSAMEIFAQIPILPVPAPRGGGGVRSDTAPAPAGLPAGSVASVIVFGTVSAVNTVTGEWAIGSPPVFVYEHLGTIFQGTPALGTEVKVVATRTLAPGPIVAEVIVQRPGGALPAAPPTREMFFLFNGTIQAVAPAVSAPGLKLGGTIWTIGGIPFRIDDPNFPAVIDPFIGLGVGLNPVVTVEFSPPVAVNVVRNVAVEIFAQVPSFIPPVKHPNPVLNTEPSPPGLPAGAWKLFVIAGRVSAVDAATGEWQIGTPPIFAYDTLATVFGGARLPVVGDDVRIVANRTAAPGPVVADVITFRAAGPQPVAPPTVTTAFLFNGAATATSAAAWTVGGVSFVANDPNFPVVIDAGLGLPPLNPNVTVEFMHTGPPGPDAALWAPLTLNAALGRQVATVTPPVQAAARTGTLFLRATNAQQQVVNTQVAAALAIAAPPAAPSTLTATGVSTALQADLTWTDNAVNETGFRVERAIDSAFTIERRNFDVAANLLTGATVSLNDSTVADGQTYFYRVLAVNAIGDSAASNVGQVVTGFAPGAPTNLAASVSAPPAGAPLVNLTWLDNANNELEYHVERAIDANFTTIVHTFMAPNTQFATDTTVALNQTFFYRIHAMNGVGSSDFSNVAQVNIALPAAPTGLTATSAPGAVALAWTDAATNETDYRIERSTDNFATAPSATFTAAANATSFNDATGIPLTTYMYRVIAINGLGSSPASNVATAAPAIPPNPPNTAPTNVTATVASATQVNLSWIDTTPDETSFLVERSKDGINYTIVSRINSVTGPATGQTITFNDTTAAPATSYTYRVRAGNATGDSPSSGVAPATTPAIGGTLPPPPVGGGGGAPPPPPPPPPAASGGGGGGFFGGGGGGGGVVRVPPRVASAVPVVVPSVKAPNPVGMKELGALIVAEERIDPDASKGIDDKGKDVFPTSNIVSVGANAEGKMVFTLPLPLSPEGKLKAFDDVRSGLKLKDDTLTKQIKDDSGNVVMELEAKIDPEASKGTGAAAELVAKSMALQTVEQKQHLSIADPLVGWVSGKLRVDLKKLPNGAALRVAIDKKAVPMVQDAFNQAAKARGGSIKDVAFVMTVQESNLVNGKDMGAATVTMLVSSAWVTAQGGQANVRIIRIAENGDKEVLDTAVAGLGADTVTFAGTSPNGLSTFGLAAMLGAPAPGQVAPAPAPVVPAGPNAPATITQSISSQLMVMWGFDAATQTWNVYDPMAPAPANTLMAMVDGQGYWIQVKAATTLTSGTKSRQLLTGWNLVGW